MSGTISEADGDISMTMMKTTMTARIVLTRVTTSGTISTSAIIANRLSKSAALPRMFISRGSGSYQELYTQHNML